jgi:integrase
MLPSVVIFDLLSGLLTRCLPGIRGFAVEQKLTPAFVDKAKSKPGADRSFFWDVDPKGFGLMVTEGGVRSYVIQYRAAGVSRRMTLGRSTTLSLKDARNLARARLGDVARGKDPLADKRKAKAEESDALRAVAEEFYKAHGKSLRSLEERRKVLTRLVIPKFGARAIGSIGRVEIVRLLDRIERENGPVMADHSLAYLRRLFNWHAARSGDDFRSPIVKGMARSKPSERRRQRTLSDEELRAVWAASEPSASPFNAFVRFLLLTAVRRNEGAGINRAEISSDEWIIPANRYKTKTEFLIPLSQAAREVLAAAPKVGDAHFLFSTDGKHPISGFSKFKAEISARSGVTGWTLHDLRRTARSLMSRAGVDADHAERALGHAIGGVRGTYDRYAYREEKRRAFEALATQIDRIVQPKRNVIALRGATPTASEA